MPPRRHRLAITARRLDITATESGSTIAIADLAATERLAAAAPPRRWSTRTRRLAWAAAVLLHAAVIAFALLFFRARPQPESPSTSDVAVVFDNGGEQKTAAPPAERQGPNSIAQAPPPAAPPPPPQAQQPEVNLNMPDMPLAEMQSAPTPQQVQPQPHPSPRPVPRPQPPQKYVVMNDMSYGTPVPPTPNAQHALNMSLPESDTQAVMGSDFTVKGNIGADYMAELHKWVQDHGYYPNAAAAQDQEGNAVVEFTVDRTGHVTAEHLLQSSGSPFIDQAWFQLFADNQLPPFPPGTKSDSITVEYTGEFQLLR